ncbi:hypothetical protein D3C74_219900 [compost metagenome]
MYMYNLEKTKNTEEFMKLVLESYNTDGLEAALKILKKSGICISPFGTGMAKNPRLYNDVIRILKAKEQKGAIEILNRFEKEVMAINDLYKNYTKNYLIRIEDLLPDEDHINAYLITLELFLRNHLGGAFKVRSGLNNTNSDIHENVVVSSGDVIHYLMNYKKFPLKDVTKKINLEYVKAASKHIDYAAYKELLNTVLELWSYFEVDFSIGENVTIIAKGDYTLGKTISHLMFMDIRNAKMSRFAYDQYLLYGENSTYNKTRKLAPSGYISFNEKLTCEFIKEYFATSNLEYKFDGVTIAEFIRAYLTISIECETFFKKRKLNRNQDVLSLSDVCIVKSKNKWINLLVTAGIKLDSAKKIIDNLTFNEKSKDLFDCPLIRVDDYLVVLPSVSLLTDPSRALLSNLKRRNIDVNIKGDLFEEELINTVVSTGLQCINLERYDYECDAVFSLDNDLYFVEAKHLNDPTSYREYMSNLDKIHEACVQLERIVDYYSTHTNLSEIKEKLQISEINNIYKVVVTNTAQGKKNNINNTFVIDETCFTGYFLRRPPQIVSIKNGKVDLHQLFDEYYTGDISSKQFLKFIEASPFINFYLDRTEYHTFDFIEQLGVKLVDFGIKINTYVDIDSLSNSELMELNRVYGTDHKK